MHLHVLAGLIPWCAATLAPGLPLRTPQVEERGAEASSSAPLAFRIRRLTRSVIEVELQIAAPEEADVGRPRRLEWPTSVPPACIREFSIEPEAANLGADLHRALEASHREGEPAASWHIDLPPTGALRVRYHIAPDWPPTPGSDQRAASTLLIGAESILCAGRWPFGVLSTAEEVQIEFDLGFRAYADPPCGSGLKVPAAALEDVLFAFGPWRFEEQRGVRLLLPAEGLRLDAQGQPFAESDAHALRNLVAHRSLALERAWRARSVLVLLPEPPAEAGPYLFYAGGRSLALSKRAWRIPTALAADPLRLAERLHAELPEVQKLAQKDRDLANAFASAFALETLNPLERHRARYRDLPCCPQRASAEDRARWALLEALEVHGSSLTQDLYRALDDGATDLAAAWSSALAARAGQSMAHFEALRRGAEIFTSEVLGGPFTVCVADPLPEPGLYRLQAHAAPQAIALRALDQTEREAWRDLRARLAMELAWPLARRRTRWPAWDASDIQLMADGALRIPFDALYDAEAGWAGELTEGEFLQRLVAGGALHFASGSMTQRLYWRCGDLAAAFELEFQGVEALRENREGDPGDESVAQIRPQRHGASLQLLIRGLHDADQADADVEAPAEAHAKANAKANAELRWQFLCALQAAPGWMGESASQKAIARTPRAGGSSLDTAAHHYRGRDRQEPHTPSGFSGIPIAERAGFGFQRWDEGSQSWITSALETDAYDARKHPEEAALHAELLKQFTAELRWPLPRVGTFTPQWGGDDLPYRAGHDDAHDAIDLGSRLYAPEERIPHHYPAGTPVYTPHRRAKRLLHPAGYPILIVELHAGEYRLRVRLDLVHVRPSDAWRALDPEVAVPEDLVLGTLQAFDSSSPWGGWITTDPKLRMRGVSKGNHLHFATAGLFETHSADMRRNERKNAFLRAEVCSALIDAYASARLLDIALVRQTPLSSASASPTSQGAPGFHAIFDGVEYQSALARDDYDAERQPLEHAAFAAAMRSRISTARPLRDAESGFFRPIWNDGWLFEEPNGELLQRVETPIEVDGAPYRLRLTIKYRGLSASEEHLGAVGPATHFQRRDLKTEPSIELLHFSERSVAAQHIEKLARD